MKSAGRFAPPSSSRSPQKEVPAATALRQLKGLRLLGRSHSIPSLEMLLPCCLALHGKPYTLKNHFPFSALFSTTLPANVILKTGRQVSKSTSIAAHGVILSACIPYFRTLYVTPLSEQVRRFSNNYVRPFIDLSPIRPMLVDASSSRAVLQRTFRNQSMMIFSFAFLDVDRIRGVSADKVAIDEVQDMDPDHIPVIREVMSYSEYAIMQYAGTPKSLDNTIEGLWRKSSMAEWFIPCRSCGHWNIPSLEYDIDAMIGPLHPNISEKHPATICAKCSRPINPRHGRWVHRYPDRRWLFPGYHVPQIILPLHYARPDKWQELLAKREGWGNMTKAKFYNEVLGESVDAGQKLITETQLRAASRLPWRNDPRSPADEVMRRIPHYTMRVLGIDWGGGGEDEISYTTLALLGMAPDGQIHTLWGKRLLASQDHLQEAREIIHWVRKLRADLVAHDFTGAGAARETVLVQAGYPADRIMAIQYMSSASHDMIKYVPPSPLHARGYYRANKTSSLLYTITAIKTQHILFFQYDYESTDNPGLIADFLSLVEEKTSTKAGEVYRIVRSPMLTDDFAHSVNLGALALWHANQKWPDFSRDRRVQRIIASQVFAGAYMDDEDWQDN